MKNLFFILAFFILAQFPLMAGADESFAIPDGPELEQACVNPKKLTSAGQLASVLNDPINNTILPAVTLGDNFYVLCFKSIEGPLKLQSGVEVKNELERMLILHDISLIKANTFVGESLLSITPPNAIDNPKPVIIYNGNIEGNVKISGEGHIVANSTLSSLTVSESASDILVSGTDIVGPGANVYTPGSRAASTAGIAVSGQKATITATDFLGNMDDAIKLIGDANGGIQMVDTAKVFRKMSGDGTKDQWTGFSRFVILVS